MKAFMSSVAMLATIALPTAAAAQDINGHRASSDAIHYSLPPARLADTLRQIAQLSGRRVTFRESSVATLRSGPVTGDLTPAEAVAAAVAGTGLSVSQQANGDLLVGISASEEGDILVVGRRDEAETGFKVSRSETATRSGASLLEVPGSVTVITSKVLETQQLQSLTQALNNVSGLVIGESTQGPADTNIRGFGGAAITSNGVNDPSATNTNVFAVERLEVLKGPQAILSGAGSLGGGVNVVTKKPQAEPLLTLLAQYGSYDDFTRAADATGKITADGKLSYRFIGSIAKAGTSPGGFNGRTDYAVLPQLRYNDKGTDFILGYSWGSQYDPLRKYTSARRDGIIAPVPEIRLGNPEDGFRSRQERVFYQFEQVITPHISFISRLQYATSSLDIRVYGGGGPNYDRGAANNNPNGTISFFGNITSQDDKSFAGDHYLRVAGKTGPISHTLSVGINHSWITSTQRSWDGPYFTASIYPPQSGIEFPSLDVSGIDPFSIYRSRGNQIAAFAQDLMAWGPITVLANIRTTRYSSSTRSTFNFGGEIEESVEPRKKMTHTTPGIGVVYRIKPNFSVYASYAEGFSPQFLNRCGGGMVDPTMTKNREIGAKLDLFSGKLSLTASAFKLSLSNQISYDGNNDCYETLNGQTTKGLEFDVQGQLLPGWNLIANYAYNTFEDASDPDRIFAGTPHHKGSLWTTYTIQRGLLKGIGGGFGVTAASRYDGTWIARYPYKIPAQARIDLTLFYDRDPWNVTLGVKNVLDDRLYGTASTTTYIPVEPGRTFMLTVKRSFR